MTRFTIFKNEELSRHQIKNAPVVKQTADDLLETGIDM
jgi:hypothetical protein